MTDSADAPDSPPDEITFERLVGNRVIETAAIDWVMDLERAAGRVPIDRRSVASYPADIESPPRTIEVKAVGSDARGTDLPVEVAQVERARSDPEFYLYLVDRIAQGNRGHFRL